MFRSRKLTSLLRVAALPAIVIIAVVVAWKLGYFELDRRQRLFDTVQRLRVVRGIGVAFLFGYAIAVTLGLPMAVLTLLGGAIFGLRVGAFVAWGGSIVGTLFAYELARTVAKKPIQKLFGEHKLLRRLKAHDSVLTLFRLRVIPAAPFAVLAFLAGIAGVSLLRLLLGTALGVLPSVIAYAYVGSALMRGAVSADDASSRALWIAGGVTVVMVVVSLFFGMRERRDE
jgi:uncharacterized membrane protein YdjX (TVP38/TMEM64 family)